MILHIRLPEGTKVDQGENDLLIAFPETEYTDSAQIIGCLDIHTHDKGDRADRGRARCTPPYDRMTVGMSRKGFLRVQR